MYATTVVLAAISTIASAWPTVQIRAGGPAIDPIPDNCTVTHPAPSTPNFRPTASTLDDLLYQAYYEPAVKSTAAQTCLEQCYGYGDHTECAGAYYAENVPVPKGYYGSDGNQMSPAGCLMFNRTLTADDFEPAPAGQAISAFTGDISCPTS